MQLTIYKMMYEELTGKKVPRLSLLKWEPTMEEDKLFIAWKDIEIEPVEKMEELGIRELVKISGLKPIKVGKEVKLINRII
jgi:hypothetical protein